MRLLSLIVACCLAGTVGQAESLRITKTCSEWFLPTTYQHAIVAEANPQYDRPPNIFGKLVRLGPMRIRILDAATGGPFKTNDVTLSYGWNWLEYPYPEHAWGAWSSASDSLQCSPDDQGWIESPPHNVQARGWYDGKYTRWPCLKRPHFKGVSFAARSPGGLVARFSLTPSVLKRFEKSDLVVLVNNGWKTELQWVPSVNGANVRWQDQETSDRKQVNETGLDR